MSFFSLYDRGASILAKRQHARTGDIGVLEHCQGHHAVIVGCLRVVQNGCDLLQMRGTQEEIDIVKRLRAQKRERLRIDAQHLLTFKRTHLHMFFREQPILSVIGTGIKQRFVNKRSSWHVRFHNSEKWRIS